MEVYKRRGLHVTPEHILLGHAASFAAMAAERAVAPEEGPRVMRDMPWSSANFVSAPGGVPDLILYIKHGRAVRYVVTFEFKLANWRKALAQAFRHRNFGNEAYVVLDHASASAAIKNLDEFKRANVGLLTLSPTKELVAWHVPDPHRPFSLQFSQAFAASLLSRKRLAPNEVPFVRSTRGGTSLAHLRRLISLQSASLKTGEATAA